MQANISFIGTIRSGFTAFRKSLKFILIFEIFYKIATVFIVKPLLSLFMQLMLNIAGNKLAFNETIWRFIFTVPGVITVILLSGTAVLCVYFEFAVIISFARQALEKDKIGIKEAAIHSLWSARALKSFDMPLFAVYALFLLPIVNMGVTSSLIPTLEIPNFITSELIKMPSGEWLLLAAALFFLVSFLFLLFVLPAMTLERCRFVKAVKRSMIALRTYHFKMLGLLLVFVVAWFILFLGPRQVFEFFFGVPTIGLGEAVAYYGFSLRTPIMVLVWITATLLQIVLMPLLLTFLTSCYLPMAEKKEPAAFEFLKIGNRLDLVTGGFQSILMKVGGLLKKVYLKLISYPFIKKYKKLLAALLIIILIWTVMIALIGKTIIHDPIVISHRGSAYGVENTLESIQYAIDSGANYTEIDILLSADGVPMVIHDTNLKRLSGKDINVYDLTAAELKDVQLSQNGYTGYISTLEEVVDYCDGKILLAVEYKLHGNEQEDLIEKVMQVITKNEYQKNSIFISLKFDLVKDMKERYPDYTVGYCVYGNIGRLTAKKLKSMDIDFLLIEEWMVSRKLVKTCRNARMPVYVWTVNDSKRMKDYLHMGVVGLVTDYPEAALDILGKMYNLENLLERSETN